MGDGGMEENREWMGAWVWVLVDCEWKLMDEYVATHSRAPFFFVSLFMTATKSTFKCRAPKTE
jgi:hypothetical protein